MASQIMTALPAQVTLLWALPTVYAVYLLYKLLRFGHREKHLPPGPPTVPILGNAHLIPMKNFYIKLKEWSDQYGTVYSIKIGNSTLIVINDRRAVHDLLDKRSAIYADRPSELQMDLTFGNENFAFMHVTPKWRAQRKIASQFLTPTRLDRDVAKIQEAEICTLMHDLLTTPEDFGKHLKRTTASVSSIVLHGQRGATFDSFWGSAVYTAIAAISKSIEPGTYLPTEQFPVLKWIPQRWNTGLTRATECYKTTTAIWTEARRQVTLRREAGDVRDSLMDKLLAEDIKSDVPMNAHEMSHFVGTIAQGAADTTASAMATNILFLAKHPEVQRKAQVELDKVCGTDRMPLWSDFKELPYINCIVKEGLRIRPVVPAGIAHRAKQDDWYEGMLIPKGAAILLPPYALHYTHYPDPTTYNPDRYLNHPDLAPRYAGSPDFEDRDHYAYGAGRRICVGIHLAERTQFRITARMLWAFNIEPAIDPETGEMIEVDVGPEAYDPGFLMEPKPFKVRFVPRSEKHAEVVRRDFQGVEEFLKKWE